MAADGIVAQVLHGIAVLDARGVASTDTEITGVTGVDDHAINLALVRAMVHGWVTREIAVLAAPGAGAGTPVYRLTDMGTHRGAKHAPAEVDGSPPRQGERVTAG